MVETASDFDLKLTQEWDALAATQASTRTFLEQNTSKKVPAEGTATDLGLYAFYNNKLVGIKNS